MFQTFQNIFDIRLCKFCENQSLVKLCKLWIIDFNDVEDRRLWTVCLNQLFDQHVNCCLNQFYEVDIYNSLWNSFAACTTIKSRLFCLLTSMSQYNYLSSSKIIMSECLSDYIIIIFFCRSLNSCLDRFNKKIKIIEFIYKMLCTSNRKSYVWSINWNTLNTSDKIKFTKLLNFDQHHQVESCKTVQSRYRFID